MMGPPSRRYRAPFTRFRSSGSVHFIKRNVHRISAFSVFVYYYYYYYSTLYFVFHLYIYMKCRRYYMCIYIYSRFDRGAPPHIQKANRSRYTSWFKSESCRKWWISGRGHRTKKECTYIILYTRVCVYIYFTRVKGVRALYIYISTDTRYAIFFSRARNIRI